MKVKISETTMIAVKGITEASILSQSPTFHRLIERALEQIKEGRTRPVEALLNEL